MDATWLLRLDSEGDGPRVAVKDCIDVAGTVTTVGCRAIAIDAVPAAADAPVVATARSRGARIVGKTNLVELCRHADGTNEWTGTPVNPLDPTRLPGGSSSGSAVAVANGEADVGYGTDTGGSVRVPAACCGIAGLKPTYGRIPTLGVFELSRSLDVVGPLARDVAGLVLGMQLMEPGFTPAEVSDERSAARIRLPYVDPAVDDAVDAALRAAGYATTDVTLPAWRDWMRAADAIMDVESHLAHRHLLERRDALEARNVEDIEHGGSVPAQRVVASRRTGMVASAQLAQLLDRHLVLALPALATEPPTPQEKARLTYLTVPFNLTGLPAICLPVPRSDGGLPASIQLVGAPYAEEVLVSLGTEIERAVAA